MTTDRGGIKITGTVIAEAVGDRLFTTRDVPGVSPQTLAKLARHGYLIVVCKAQSKGRGVRNYHPATYPGLMSHPNVSEIYWRSYHD